MPKGIPEPAEVRFWRYVNKTDQCWNWTGNRQTMGYGSFCDRTGHTCLAHRFSWFLAFGFNSTKSILHRCDNRRCVRPDHLFEGTQADNIRDMDMKGRRGTVSQRGELAGTSKLITSDIARIREAVASGARQNAVAANYGVSPSAVWAVIHGRTWGHV